ncbi:MAG: hypothetical protein K5841_03850 [Fretibacterium sp.]|nr:hypothetical protein [Fretibacterium sp.]
MFQKILDHIPLFLRPAIFISGLSDIFSLWQRGDVRERSILILVFAPMLLCGAGMLFSVVSFVLFVLPSFVLRVLGWGVLTALFGAGGRYCYERMTGKSVSGGGPSFRSGSSSNAWGGGQPYTDVKFTENGTGNGFSETQSGPSASRRQEVRQRWFERVRGKQ